MPTEIKTIRLPLPLRFGYVNCYLLESGGNRLLIDTACANSRRRLERELAGSPPGLIILTHGDFDHSGNAARLRRKFGAKIAMHRGDASMVEKGDIFGGRSRGRFLFRLIAPAIFGFWRSARFSPDLYLEDGDSLSDYGFDARIVHMPGHSRGSIGVLTTEGELFGGDLVIRGNGAKRNKLIDDPAAAEASIKKLKSLGVKTVYPGHGRPFEMGELG
ncbi:MAG: MBL fold metallo-hydrolase [Dehalococcoidia bacterium]|jgi:glyoxylase-like metal-dependent hydrolase (beta-lactamase superfamily II)